MIPIITPNSPRADAKISTMRIFTNRDAFWASERAHEEPTMPTLRPQNRLDKPTVIPATKIAYPAYADGSASSNSTILACRIIAIITPYIAQASAKMTLTRFFELIRGCLMAADNSDDPVINMPHAAPRTEIPIANTTPTALHIYGEIALNRS